MLIVGVACYLWYPDKARTLRYGILSYRLLDLQSSKLEKVGFVSPSSSVTAQPPVLARPLTSLAWNRVVSGSLILVGTCDQFDTSTPDSFVRIALRWKMVIVKVSKKGADDFAAEDAYRTRLSLVSRVQIVQIVQTNVVCVNNVTGVCRFLRLSTATSAVKLETR